MTRYRVTIFEVEGTQINDTFIRATDTISALIDTVRLGPVGAGEYDTLIQWRDDDSAKHRSGRVAVNADGSITIGTRWGLPTPAEPIPDSGDLPVEVFDVA